MSRYTSSCLPAEKSSGEQKCSNAPSEATASNGPNVSLVAWRASLRCTSRPLRLQASSWADERVTPTPSAPFERMKFKSGPQPQPRSRTRRPGSMPIDCATYSCLRRCASSRVIEKSPSYLAPLKSASSPRLSLKMRSISEYVKSRSLLSAIAGAYSSGYSAIRLPRMSRARLVGINHVALEVGDLEEALAFYGRLFAFSLRGRVPGMAFLDLGDQFLALQEVRGAPAA